MEIEGKILSWNEMETLEVHGTDKSIFAFVIWPVYAQQSIKSLPLGSNNIKEGLH